MQKIPKDATQKRNKNFRINEFIEVVGYKINTEKSIAFLYNDHKESKMEN